MTDEKTTLEKDLAPETATPAGPTPEQIAYQDKINGAIETVWTALDGLSLTDVSQVITIVQNRINTTKVIATDIPKA